MFVSVFIDEITINELKKNKPKNNKYINYKISFIQKEIYE